LVFTVGIGEHAPQIRRRACEQASWLGIELDDAANAKGAACRKDLGAWEQGLRLGYFHQRGSDDHPAYVRTDGRRVVTGNVRKPHSTGGDVK
jgi:hypothetical protein